MAEAEAILMEAIRRGPVSLLYFTVRRDDFANLHPRPPNRYFLVTQVFSADDEYICTQLLGVDLRAVRYLEAQGCDHRRAASLTAADRERIQACLDQYARFLMAKVTDAVLGHIVSTGGKVQ
jgi:hypothetical protein